MLETQIEGIGYGSAVKRVEFTKADRNVPRSFISKLKKAQVVEKTEEYKKIHNRVLMVTHMMDELGLEYSHKQIKKLARRAYVNKDCKIRFEGVDDMNVADSLLGRKNWTTSDRFEDKVSAQEVDIRSIVGMLLVYHEDCAYKETLVARDFMHWVYS